MQERQRFKPIDRLDNRLSEEAERLRKVARGVEAIGLAKQGVDGHDVELWQLDRHIETFTSERRILKH
jgi:hypothetical protein